MQKEFKQLKNLIGFWNRGPMVLHNANECDSEILRFPSDSRLAVSIDSLSEEIQMGIYKDPYVWGWICALTSLSDLTATCAKPLGLMFSANWHALSSKQKKMVFKGFKDCAKFHGTYLIGGDQGDSDATVLTSVGLGYTQNYRSRKGFKDGDIICLSSKIGFNAIVGFQFLFSRTRSAEKHLLKKLPIEEILNIRKLIHAAIDNSDGYLASLALLKDLNPKFSFDICNPEKLMPRKLIEEFLKNKWPVSSVLFGELGDYNILFAVSARSFQKIQEHLPQVQILARVTKHRISRLEWRDKKIPIDLNFNRKHHSVSPKDYIKTTKEAFNWCKMNCQ